MIPQNRKLLKVLNELKDEDNEVIINSLHESIIFSKTKYKTYIDFSAAVKVLEKDGYVTSQYVLGDDGPHELLIFLTHKGVYYNAYNIEAIKQFLIKSIVVPVVVAIITAFLTTWLKPSLSQKPQQQTTEPSQIKQTK